MRLQALGLEEELVLRLVRKANDLVFDRRAHRGPTPSICPSTSATDAHSPGSGAASPASCKRCGTISAAGAAPTHPPQGGTSHCESSQRGCPIHRGLSRWVGYAPLHQSPPALAAKAERRRIHCLPAAPRISSQSIVRPSNLGGVPVFNLHSRSPSRFRLSPSNTEAGSPLRPAAYCCSPQWISPFRNVPVVTTTAFAATSFSHPAAELHSIAEPNIAVLR